MARAGPLFMIALGSGVAEAEDSSGYRFEAVYTGEILRNLDGGLATGTAYLDNLDLILELDIAEAWGLGSGTLFLYGLYNNGTTFSDERVGDLQVTSNIDAPAAWRIFEAWYEVGNESWSLRTGLYDLNSEFDVNGTSEVFLNSSHGIGAAFGQTGRNGPSIFPVSSLAVRGQWRSNDLLTVRLAVLDGVPGDPSDPASNEISLSGSDGALIVGEFDLSLPVGRRWWAGYWKYTADFERLSGLGRTHKNDGWYAGVEQAMELGTLEASVFLRYGEANDEVNPMKNYVGAGLVIDSVSAMLEGDSFGFAIASARVGRPYRELIEQSGAGSRSRETIWELTYRAPINDHLVLQPDFQWVQHPATNASLEDAVVVGLRFELSF